MRILIALFAWFCVSVQAIAASPFDGTWVYDMSTLKVLKGSTDGFEIVNGVYRCLHCSRPQLPTPTDGQPHRKYSDAEDMIAVRVDSPYQVTRIEYSQFGTKGDVTTSVFTVSQDGQKRSLSWSQTSAEGYPKSKGTQESVRLTKAKPGAHLASGMWEQTSPDTDVVNPPMSLQIDADRIHLASDTFSVDGRFNGQDFLPNEKNDRSRHSFRRISPSAFEWQYKDFRSVVQYILTYELSEDHKTLTETQFVPSSTYKAQIQMHKPPGVCGGLFRLPQDTGC